MPSCVFRRCKNYTATTRDKNIAFHALPTDGLLKQKWVKIIRTQRREDDWMPSKHSKVCSEHFLESDKYWTKKQNIRKIKKTAVPVIELKPAQQLREIKSEPNQEGDSLADVQISDEESIFDSQTTVILKRELEQCQLKNSKQQKEIYNLRRMVSRLSRRNKLLVNVNKDLKKQLKFWESREGTTAKYFSKFVVVE